MEKITYRFEDINIREIEESPINAQVMKDNDFKRLVDNIKNDKCLTSAVLLMKQNESNKLMCISGHHRIKAAKKAGLTSVPSLIINEVDESTRIRLQLAHNDIHGEPDENLLLILQNKLSIEDIKFVNVIEGVIKEYEDFEIERQEFYHTAITLLEGNHKKLEEILSTIDETKYDTYALVNKEDYEKLKSVLSKAFKKGYKTPGRAFRLFLENAEEILEKIGT